MSSFDMQSIPKVDPWKLIPEGHTFDSYAVLLEQMLPGYDEHWQAMRPGMRVSDFGDYLQFNADWHVGYWRLFFAGKILFETGLDPEKVIFDKARELGAKQNDKMSVHHIEAWIRGKPVAGRDILHDGAVTTLFAADGGKWCYFLECQRAEERFNKDPDTEKVLHARRSARISQVQEFFKLSRKYEYTLEYPSGRTDRHIGTSGLFSFFKSPDPMDRAVGYAALWKTLGDHKDRYMDLARYVLVEDSQDARLRGYTSLKHRMAQTNHIPPTVVDLVLEIIDGQSQSYHDFLDLKAKHFGLESMGRSDVNIAIFQESPKADYAKQLVEVIGHIYHISEEMGEMISSLVKGGRVDIIAREGKKAGGTCYATTTEDPCYLRFTPTGTIFDRTNMFHEFFHAIHDGYAKRKANSLFTFHAPSVMAETASIYGEMLGVDQFISHQDDLGMQLHYFEGFLEKIYNHLFRGITFAKFETELHRGLEGGETVDVLSNRWMDLENKLYGDIDLPDESKYGWMLQEKPFTSTLGTFPYAFGILVAANLYIATVKDKCDGLERFKNMASQGGSADPGDILGSIGYDIASRDFWENGLRVIQQFQERFNVLYSTFSDR